MEQYSTKPLKCGLISRLHLFFYTISFECTPHIGYHIIIFFLEKIILLTPILLLLLKYTPWFDQSLEVLSKFIIFNYFDAKTYQFPAFCLALCGMINIFFWVLAYRLLRKYRQNSSYALDYFISYGLDFSRKITFIILTYCFFYVMTTLNRKVKFSEYKQIKQDLLDPGTNSALFYLTIVFLFISFVECLFMNILEILLKQEELLSIWCDKSWHFKIINQLIKFVIVIGFVFDSNDDYLLITRTCILSIILYKILAKFCIPLPVNLFIYFIELTFDIAFFLCEFIVTILLTLDAGNSEFINNYYQYILLIPIYSLCISSSRIYLKSHPELYSFKTESEALDFLRCLIRLCSSYKKSSFVQMVGLVSIHEKNCTKTNCTCREIIKDASDRNSNKFQKIHINLNTHETMHEIPHIMKENWKLKVLNLLLSEINPNLSKSYHLRLALAEIAFYYSANYYQALCYIDSIKSHRQSFICSQFIMNLRQSIEKGMYNEQKETPELLETLEFQKKHDELLGWIDETVESTITFWNKLLGDCPKAEELMKLGKDLHSKRLEVTKLSREIAKINPNNLEFLVKYGLYTKLILHDKTTSHQAYQKIVWISENIENGIMSNLHKSSFFRENIEMMLLMVSLEESNFLTITAINNEIEHQLGYKKEELLRFSAAKLMPDYIACQHHKFVNNFFLTMKAKTIGRGTELFVKHQDGYVVFCKAYKRIVPTIQNGLQGVMLFYEDGYMNSYTIAKTDKTRRKIGALICTNKDKILDHTKEAYIYLNFTKESIANVKTNSSITNVFPELHDDNIFRYVSRPQGAVIMFNPEIIDTEEVKNEPLNPKMIWIRAVREKYGDKEVTIILFAPILKKMITEYQMLRVYGNRVFEHTNMFRNNDVYVKSNDDYSFCRSNEVESVYASPLPKKHGSDRQSNNSSLLSPTTTNNTSSSPTRMNMEIISQQFQYESLSKETPTLVKKLSILLIAFFVIVVILITTESMQFENDVTDLKGRFQMIEFFQIRYVLLSYLSLAPRTYDTYRRSTVPETFIGFCTRTRTRADRFNEYSIKTRKAFEQFKLSYDYAEVPVTYGDEKYMASFNYALIKYINEVMTFTDISNFTLAKSCIDNYKDSVCIVNNLALNFCADNGFYTLRIKQDIASEEIMSDLKKAANEGELFLYLIICVCIGIAIISAVFLTISLIIVVKDKSYVMAIFASIGKEEIEKIIYCAKSVLIRSVRFKPIILKLAGENEEKYWHNLVNDSKEEKNKENPTDTKAKKSLKSLRNGEILSIKKLVMPESKFAENVHKNETIENNNENLDFTIPENKIQEENNEQQKISEKKELLSQIDTKLRNISIFKLSIVVFSFLIYGGVSLYFNYYLYDFNKSTTDFFYQLSKRNVYGVVLSGMMREAVRVRNKDLLNKNPDSNGEKYMQDYMDEIVYVEERVKKYKLTGDKRIFKKYFELTDKLDSAEFCDYVDSYQIGQTGNCNTSYKGPLEQGLTAGMSYFIAYHNTYAAKIKAANLTDDKIADDIYADPALTLPAGKLITYLQSALELQLIEYRKDTVNFYDLIRIIIIAKAAGFLSIFMIMYIIILMGLLNTLKDEIWLTHGMINLIPMFIQENNTDVQNQIWDRRKIS